MALQTRTLRQFNPVACAAPIFGCTSPDAMNYNPAANQSDGSCVWGSDARGPESFYRNCPNGTTAEPAIFSVPENWRTSTESKLAANLLRDQDYQIEGYVLAALKECSGVETGKLYMINSTNYLVAVDNNVNTSDPIPAQSSGPVLVAIAGEPLLFSSLRVRKPDGSSFTPDDELRIQIMRAASGGTPNGPIPTADGQGISPLSIFTENYESLTLEDPSNPNAPSFTNYQNNQNFVIILDEMVVIPPLHFSLELLRNGVALSDTNRISKGQSIVARVRRMENRHVETSFFLELKPIGPTTNLNASPMSTTVFYGDDEYVDYSFENIGWDEATFNPAISVNISKVNPDDDMVVLDSSSKAIWVNM